MVYYWARLLCFKFYWNCQWLLTVTTKYPVCFSSIVFDTLMISQYRKLTIKVHGRWKSIKMDFAWKWLIMSRAIILFHLFHQAILFASLRTLKFPKARISDIIKSLTNATRIKVSFAYTSSLKSSLEFFYQNQPI